MSTRAVQHTESTSAHQTNYAAEQHYPVAAIASLCLPYPGSVLIARPLTELFAYIKDRELPPFALIARVIKTLVLSVFIRHLYDHTLLVQSGNIIHSLQGRLETISLDKFTSSYPKMFKSGTILIYNNKAKGDTAQADKHPHEDSYIGGLSYVRKPLMLQYKKITPQTIVEYYREFYGIELTDQKTDNTIWDLLRSKYLKNECDYASIKRRFADLHQIDISIDEPADLGKTTEEENDN